MNTEMQDGDLGALKVRANELLGRIETLLGASENAEGVASGHMLASGKNDAKGKKGEARTWDDLLARIESENEQLHGEIAKSHASALAAIQKERVSILGEMRGIADRVMDALSAIHGVRIRLGDNPAFLDPKRRGYTSGDE